MVFLAEKLSDLATYALIILKNKRTGKNDIFDNRLILGDNILALKTLEQ